MEDVVKAIEKLSEKDIIDYLLVIVPIVVSIVAIFISIATARKQNKIALFELRYKALITIKAILRFDSLIDAAGDRYDIILSEFNMCFHTQIDPTDKTRALVELGRTMNIMDEKICVLANLLEKHDSILLQKSIESLSNIMCDVINQKVNREECKEFHTLCKILKTSTYEKIESCIRV